MAARNAPPLDVLVLEYLRFAGFDNAAVALAEECRDVPGDRDKQADVEAKRDAILDDCLACFDQGDRDATFEMWNCHLPKEALEDPNAARLQFYMNIYFAIYPLHPRSKTSREESSRNSSVAISMKAFRTFLETQGVQLAQTPEFLPYYALPFVHDPTMHPSFKGMFQDEWVDDLRSQLQSFLSERLELPALPRLLQLYENASDPCEAREGVEPVASQSSQRANAVIASATDFVKYQASLLSRLEGICRRRSQLPLDLLSEARQHFKQFTDVLSTSDSDHVEHSDDVRQSAPKFHSLPQSPDRSHQQAAQDTRRAWTPPGPVLSHEPVSPPSDGGETSPARRLNRSISPSALERDTSNVSLDFSKVKNDLQSLSTTHACVLLQALRWRLGKSRFGRQRCTILQQYISNDLLGCQHAADNSQTSTPECDLLATLLRSEDNAVRESCVRLINTMATDSIGRSYLLLHPRLIPLLCMTLTLEKSDTGVHQNALGALQKFSLRRQPQTQMIGLGMIEYLARILSDIEGLSEYSTEYGTALLMNLSLRTMGKHRAEQSPVDILSVLNDLLEHENPQVRTYINGTLYSVLTRPVLKERARALGMGTMLSYLMERSNDQYRRQIAYILQQLDSECDDEEAQSDNNEEDADEGDADFEDEEEFEEDDEDELLERGISGKRGEELLRSEYLAESNDNPSKLLRHSVDAKPLRQSSHRSAMLLNSSLAKAMKAMPPRRPLTPQMQQLKTAFDVFDVNKDGYITFAELKKSMRELGEKKTLKELHQMFDDADTNNDKKISFDEFVAITTPDFIDNSVDEKKSTRH